MAKLELPADETRLTAGEAVLSAIGATLLIVTEMLGAIFAFAFAVGGLLGIGDTATLVLMGILAVPSLYAAALLTRRILRVEAKLRALPPA